MSDFFDNWKTRIFGLLQVMFGAVMTYSDHLREALSPQQFAMAMFFTGVITMMLGFINAHHAKKDAE
jgi:uncharacterized membrane protein HdeD (DUF308 family)